MYFKRLELVGFKSFCNKTVLDFEPGITAVVGPNGCGKSNIFDSIRWVLGEQSVKALRGSHMEDVIFNGTDSKEPLGMAEVTVTFDNSQNFFSVDSPEVAITRRIFRSGESEYLLNKTQVRLKDISELLAGTGIGAESYSLVEQGKIDLVLSSRPEDRRLVFDEAAGVTRYKSQKKETLRRLEETEQNLLRVNDIVVEVKRQIGSLERQANKARRYKEVFGELKEKEIRRAGLERKRLLSEKEDILSRFKQLEEKQQEIVRVVAEQEARISTHQSELKGLEDGIMEARNAIMNLENEALRGSERIRFNSEKIAELEASKQYLASQVEQVKKRIVLDEEKLNNLKEEHASINRHIEEKHAALKEKEGQLDELNLSIKQSLEAIAAAKKGILDFVTRISALRNNMTDLLGRQQTHLARKKRLDIEKAKVREERSVTEGALAGIKLELEGLEKSFQELGLELLGKTRAMESESESLRALELEIVELEKQRLTLESHREFLEKLKTKYEDLGESMSAVIYLDKLPSEKVTGLVIKVKEYLPGDERGKQAITGEAKPIDLDTQRIDRMLLETDERLNSSRGVKAGKTVSLEAMKLQIDRAQQSLRQREMDVVNKKAQTQSVAEQFDKLKEEEDIITLELGDVEEELSKLELTLAESRSSLEAHEAEQKKLEGLIVAEEHTIGVNSSSKEQAVVVITQTKTELEALSRRIDSDAATLKILEDTYRQDVSSLENLAGQLAAADEKKLVLEKEIQGLQQKIEVSREEAALRSTGLKGLEAQYKEASSWGTDIIKKMESDRKALDALKQQSYDAQMSAKDAEFKLAGLRERMLQAYKTDLEAEPDAAGQAQAEETPIDGQAIEEEIIRLKEKLDSYGSVNLVAIEEYDELKKRYDFLTQQQNDLLTAKASLHEAIQKINRTTKKIFLETFEKIRLEFRNYFRLLFNGGDAQVFLIDEQDPLESGIEIICRPPGKKLQNVLLLSGGEKSMSATALIFAIFKVKPSPFCVLDEIDAALDEANVDRFGRMLHEFSQASQFIVITHNKKTIANANLMYGITMEESGVSKIVSVKFAEQKGLSAKTFVPAQPVAP